MAKVSMADTFKALDEATVPVPAKAARVKRSTPVGEGTVHPPEVPESAAEVDTGRALALVTPEVSTGPSVDEVPPLGPAGGAGASEPATPAVTAGVTAPTVEGDRPKAKYQRLDRKETLLWPDQRDRLETLGHELIRARGIRMAGAERITANTLIRVAIDLLLDRQEDLAGVDEDELRASVGLPARTDPAGR